MNKTKNKEFSNDIDKEFKIVLKEMMKWFHNVCLENDITYYALGGTMLGAVRHKGFIPWDDDIDVGVPRKDYERLSEIINSLKSKYVLETPKDLASDYHYAYSKLYDTSTTLIEKSKINVKRGVFLDVFPLDGLDDDYHKSKKNLTI